MTGVRLRPAIGTLHRARRGARFGDQVHPGKSMRHLLLAPAGGDQPHNNLQPYLTCYFNIALQGVFPPRG